MGQTSFADGEWIGIKLDTPNGKNDGSVQAVKYFDAKPLHGIFVRRDQLKMITSSPIAQKMAAHQRNSSSNNNIVYKISHATFTNDYHYHFPDQESASFPFSPATPVASLHTATASDASTSMPSKSFQLIENDCGMSFSPPAIQEDRENKHIVMMPTANKHPKDVVRSTDYSVTLSSPLSYDQRELEDCDDKHGTPSTVEYSNAYSADASTIFYSPLLLTTASGKYSLREGGNDRGQLSQTLNDLAVENHALRDRVLSHHKTLELTLVKINELHCDLQSMKTEQRSRGRGTTSSFLEKKSVTDLKEQLDVLDRGVEALTRAIKSKRKTGCCFNS